MVNRRHIPPTLMARFVTRYALIVVVSLMVTALAFDRLLASGANARILLAVGLALTALVGIIAVAAVARSFSQPLHRITESVSRMSAGHLDARIPPDGTAELAVLAESLNRMAEDLDARIEEARRDRHGREVILSAMEEGVVLIDSEDRVGYANPAARRMLGETPRSLRGLAPHALRGLVDEARASASPRQRELETGLPARIVRASALPIENRGDVLLVLRDVTAARRVEAMRRDFVADASHELKTPAASIQASAETLERALDDDPRVVARFADRLRRDAVRLSRIVADLLDLSRLESERPTLEPVRLDRLVAEEVDRLGSQAKEAGVTVDVQAGPAAVRGSEKDLALLARNLLDNAIRYTPRGGRVKVGVEAGDAEAVLSVSDTGVGIPTRDLPRVFERFYRVDRARSRETGGTGLGLAIARHVAEQHGGRIRAESELGQGSIFRVTLPLSEEPAPAPR